MITREYLIHAMRLKWTEHAIDALAHLVFLACLSEDDYIKMTHRKLDTNNVGRYQMAAFFSAFLFSILDLMLYGYFLQVSHVYEIVSESEDEVTQNRI